MNAALMVSNIFYFENITILAVGKRCNVGDRVG